MWFENTIVLTLMFMVWLFLVGTKEPVWLFVEMENLVCHPLTDWWSLFKHVVILSIYESDPALKRIINVLQYRGRRSFYWMEYPWISRQLQPYLIFSTILNSCYGIFWLLFWKENTRRTVLAVAAGLQDSWPDVALCTQLFNVHGGLSF